MSSEEEQTKTKWRWQWPWVRSEYTVCEELEIRRSGVRKWVTHGAAWFLFGGGILLVAYLVSPYSIPISTSTTAADSVYYTDSIYMENRIILITEGVRLFQVILPVAAAIISFWFAGRVMEKNK